VRDRGEAKPGALNLINELQHRLVPLAIASSSSSEIIDAVVEKLDLAGVFQVLQSAEHEPYGKPHPGVYIAAARALGVLPATCLALEDSANGLLAAKSAKMSCFVVPDPAERNDRRFCIADRNLNSLLEIDLTSLELG
jgi:sugar-phosphatase